MAKNQIRRDIPYADRLLMEKYNNIREHRDDAARTALKIGCVALNNTEGLGYIRLIRYAVEQQKLTEEYYRDPEVQEKHLNDRLTQIGFVMKDGRMLGAMDSDGKTVKVSEMTDRDVTKDRRQLWSGWISTMDKLPETFKPVILCRNTPRGYKVEQGMRDVNGWWKVCGRCTEQRRRMWIGGWNFRKRLQGGEPIAKMQVLRGTGNKIRSISFYMLGEAGGRNCRTVL